MLVKRMVHRTHGHPKLTRQGKGSVRSFGFDLSVFECRDVHKIQRAIAKALGERIDMLPESRDAAILLKPNFNSNMNALTGNTTDLRVIVGVIRFLKDSGYRDITIGDGPSSGFYHFGINVISQLGIDRVAKRFGVRLLDFNHVPCREVNFGGGLVARVADVCLDSDFLINLPKLKMHFEVQMSACLKNMIGCLVGLDKMRVHDDLSRNILRLNERIRPDLHIVDGLVAMEGKGPSGGTPANLGLILVGSDPALVDLACAKLIGLDYEEVPYLRLAEHLGRITSGHHRYVDGLELRSLQKKLRRAKVNPLVALAHYPRYKKYIMRARYSPGIDRLFSTGVASRVLNALELRQDVFVEEEPVIDGLFVDRERCDECKICARYCPLGFDLPDQLSNRKNMGCIDCLYCFFVCPRNAIRLQGKLGFLSEQIKRYDKLVRDMVKSNSRSNN